MDTRIAAVTLQTRANCVNVLTVACDANRAKTAATAPDSYGELGVDVAAELERQIYVNAEKDLTYQSRIRQMVANIIRATKIQKKRFDASQYGHA